MKTGMSAVGKTSVVLVLTLGLSLACGAEPLVKATGFDQPESWQRKPFLGKDFFPLLSGVYWAAVGCTNVPAGGWSAFEVEEIR